MQLGILATNGGPHPAEKWARMTAWMVVNQLIDIDEKSATAKAVEMREVRDELQNKVYRVLKSGHAKVQDGERGKIKELGSARLAQPIHDAIGEHVDIDAIVATVIEETKLHPDVFAHYSKDETKDALRAQLVRDFASVMDIERDWHANGHMIVNGVAVENPDYDRRDPHVQAHKAARAPQLQKAAAA